MRRGRGGGDNDIQILGPFIGRFQSDCAASMTVKGLKGNLL